MSNWFAIPLAFLLLADADIPRVNSLRPPANLTLGFPSDEEPMKTFGRLLGIGVSVEAVGSTRD